VATASPTPEIAVIVGAYSRRDYLRAALASLLAQTLPRDRFEIVVTKNFLDPALDRELAEAGCLVLFDEEPRIGRWLRHAIDRSRAPIVTFLDDDDEFEPGRLAELLAVFARLPDLGFYRNRVRVIDGAGRPVPIDRWRVHEVDAGFDRLGAVHFLGDRRDGLLELATQTTTSTFNTSSMALRRELLDGEVGAAFERTQLEDTFLFLAGALSTRGLYLDDRRLTRFRFYGGNVTHRVRWLWDAAVSQRDMAELARARGRPDFAGWLDRLAVHYERMFRGSTLVDRISASAGRAEVARLTGGYLRYLGRHPEERAPNLDTWAAAAYGLAYVGVPSVARPLARRRLTARAVD
jgi:glycosyltransferase involved in cell wall biosynthesis